MSFLNSLRSGLASMIAPTPVATAAATVVRESAGANVDTDDETGWTRLSASGDTGGRATTWLTG
jgi:hypothetical protein